MASGLFDFISVWGFKNLKEVLEKRTLSGAGNCF